MTLNRRKKPGKRLDRCGPTGKRRYANEGAARAVLETLQAKAVEEPRRHEVRAYACRGCGGWHLSKQGQGLTRRVRLASAATPIPQRNERQQAAKATRGRKKHAAFLRSGIPEIVRARSGGRCEFAIPMDDRVLDRGHRFEWATRPETWRRCEVTADALGRALDLCHQSYHGYGGEEDPAKVLDGCPGCHTLWGTLYQPQHTQRGRRAS